jgi:hypothetical protein
MLVTRLNGKEMQRSGTDMLIHSIPAIIEFCSVFTPLAPGDIIAAAKPRCSPVLTLRRARSARLEAWRQAWCCANSACAIVFGMIGRKSLHQ